MFIYTSKSMGPASGPPCGLHQPPFLISNKTFTPACAKRLCRCAFSQLRERAIRGRKAMTRGADSRVYIIQKIQPDWWVPCGSSVGPLVRTSGGEGRTKLARSLIRSYRFGSGLRYKEEFIRSHDSLLVWTSLVQNDEDLVSSKSKNDGT